MNGEKVWFCEAPSSACVGCPFLQLPREACVVPGHVCWKRKVGGTFLLVGQVLGWAGVINWDREGQCPLTPTAEATCEMGDASSCKMPGWWFEPNEWDDGTTRSIHERLAAIAKARSADAP